MKTEHECCRMLHNHASLHKEIFTHTIRPKLCQCSCCTMKYPCEFHSKYSIWANAEFLYVTRARTDTTLFDLLRGRTFRRNIMRCWRESWKKRKRKGGIYFPFFSVNIHRMVFSCTIKSSALSHIYSAYVAREAILLSLSPAEKGVVLSNKTGRSKNLKSLHQATSKQRAFSIRAWPRYE
jgi:hypothetical protein